MAIASDNPGMAAEAQARILQIQMQQRTLDLEQKALIYRADISMTFGIQKVLSQLKSQNQNLQSRLPDFFNYRIHHLQSNPTFLAVKPDIPELAPVYELKQHFEDSQALSVSWISDFQTSGSRSAIWILQKHQKKDYCSASLKESGVTFLPVLMQAKSL